MNSTNQIQSLECFDDIPSWNHQHNNIIVKNITKQIEINNTNLEDDKSKLNKILCDKVALWKGDIIKLKVDAIVNSTTEGYIGEFGVDAAIHSAAGLELRNECQALRKCKTGEAKITRGYKLATNYIIHTVGPINDDVVDLKSCYENSLAIMLRHNLQTIAFPCISTGERGFPREQAANVAIWTVKKFLEKSHNNVHKIIFCTFLQEDYQIYNRLMWKYFPIQLS